LLRFAQHPPLCFAKRESNILYICAFPLFAEQRGGKEGGEFMKIEKIREIDKQKKLHKRTGIISKSIIT
jgi:hypothetical protein